MALLNVLVTGRILSGLRMERLEGEIRRMEILNLAKDWNPDLIVVGSHGRRALTVCCSAAFSEAVAVHAPCSVDMIRWRCKVPPLLVAVEEALERRAEREASRIKVEVRGGLVKLRGHVRSLAEKRAVLGTVSYAPGVFAVDDELFIDPLF
jgi:hypothetical protein